MTTIHRRAPACALAAALAVAGCGGGDELGKAELAKKADAICIKYTKQAENLGQPNLSDPKKAEGYFNKAKDLAQKQQDELTDLTPASDVKADYSKLTKASQGATDLLGDLAKAAGDQDKKKATELAQKLEPLSADVKSAANSIGADSCAT